ncbi:MAG: hypothetical protein HKN33_12165, partial [Pyrinomonadaceae bacterium]|nr:hypothetical protein [Pyrinomonadaceae bacterium]
MERTKVGSGEDASAEAGDSGDLDMAETIVAGPEELKAKAESVDADDLSDSGFVDVSALKDEAEEGSDDDSSHKSSDTTTDEPSDESLDEPSEASYSEPPADEELDPDDLEIEKAVSVIDEKVKAWDDDDETPESVVEEPSEADEEGDFSDVVASDESASEGDTASEDSSDVDEEEDRADLEEEVLEEEEEKTEIQEKEEQEEKEESSEFDAEQDDESELSIPEPAEAPPQASTDLEVVVGDVAEAAPQESQEVEEPAQIAEDPGVKEELDPELQDTLIGVPLEAEAGSSPDQSFDAAPAEDSTPSDEGTDAESAEIPALEVEVTGESEVAEDQLEPVPVVVPPPGATQETEDKPVEFMAADVAEADEGVTAAGGADQALETGDAADTGEEKQYTTPNIGHGDTDGSKTPKLRPLDEGTILNGRYEIVRKIGGGGMGAVYLASDKNLGGVLRAVKEMVQSYIEKEQQEK